MVTLASDEKLAPVTVRGAGLPNGALEGVMEEIVGFAAVTGVAGLLTLAGVFSIVSSNFLAILSKNRSENPNSRAIARATGSLGFCQSRLRAEPNKLNLSPTMISRMPPQAEKAPVRGLRNNEPQVESVAASGLTGPPFAVRCNRLSKPPTAPTNNRMELAGRPTPAQ